MENATDIQRVPIMSPLVAQVNEVLERTPYFMADFRLHIATEKTIQQVSNFVVMPTEVITKDNGRIEEKYIKVVGYLTDETLPEIVLSLREFERMDWIASKWGLRPMVSIVRNAPQFIRQVAQILGNAYAEKTTIYTHTGWKCVDDEYLYLHGGGAIGKIGVIVELDGSLHGYTLPDTIVNAQEAVSASHSLKEIAPHDVSIPLLSLVYLSPLNEFFKQAGHEPSFITMIVGQTGTLKSTLAALTLNHFGAAFTAKNLPGSFKDTANALEAKAAVLKDSLNVIDDYYPTLHHTEYTKMTATIQALIRAYGDRSGRGRLSADAKLRNAYVPLGNLLITGEDVPRIEESGLARLFLLELEPGQVDKKAVSDLQGKKELLGQAMRGYIEWLQPQADTLKDILAQKFTEYRERAQSGGGHLRLAETIAWLYIGYEQFIDYAVHAGVVNEAERQTALDEAWSIFIELDDRQQKRLMNDNPVTMFLSALNELLATQRCTCVKYDEDSMSEQDVGSQRGFIGYVNKKYYFLHPDTTIAAINEFYKRQDVRFPSSKNTLLKQLHEKGGIEVAYQQGRIHRTKTKSIDGKNYRFIWLKKDELDKLNGTEEDEEE